VHRIGLGLMIGAQRARARAALVASAAIAAFAALVLAAPSASATNPPVAISDDGVTYGDSFPGQLFDGVRLVPGTSAVRSFWVKNTGTQAANLAVAVIDVSSADADLLSALTLTVHAQAQVGSVRLDSAGRCRSMVHGVPLAPGETVQVDVTFAMANVGGTTGRGSEAGFNFRVSLTSDDVPAPTGCASPTDPETSPVPSPSPTTDPHKPGGGGTVVIPGAPTTPTDPRPTQSPSPLPSAEPTASPTPDPDPSEPSEPGPGDVQPNTDRLYQEWFVAAWVLAYALGAWLGWRMVRRREGEGAVR